MPNASMGCMLALIRSLLLPMIFPQTTVCTVNTHTLPLVSMSSTSDSGVVGGSGAAATV